MIIHIEILHAFLCAHTQDLCFQHYALGVCAGKSLERDKDREIRTASIGLKLYQLADIGKVVSQPDGKGDDAAHNDCVSWTFRLFFSFQETPNFP